MNNPNKDHTEKDLQWMREHYARAHREKNKEQMEYWRLGIQLMLESIETNRGFE